jgi:hypothetical protein
MDPEEVGYLISDRHGRYCGMIYAVNVTAANILGNSEVVSSLYTRLQLVR